MSAPMLPVSTRVVAVKNVGPVAEGQPGVVTGYVEVPFFFWKRQVYLCTFFGNVRLAMKPAEIEAHEHGYSREQIGQAEDASLSVAEQLRRERL